MSTTKKSDTFSKHDVDNNEGNLNKLSKGGESGKAASTNAFSRNAPKKVILLDFSAVHGMDLLEFNFLEYYKMLFFIS